MTVSNPVRGWKFLCLCEWHQGFHWLLVNWFSNLDHLFRFGLVFKIRHNSPCRHGSYLFENSRVHLDLCEAMIFMICTNMISQYLCEHNCTLLESYSVYLDIGSGIYSRAVGLLPFKASEKRSSPSQCFPALFLCIMLRRLKTTNDQIGCIWLIICKSPIFDALVASRYQA